MQKHFELTMDQNKNLGLQSESDFEEYKRMFLETNVILLTVTAFVSTLHTLFEMLAFKNDIQFWQGRDSMEGLSVKSLYMSLVMSIIIFMYLFENDTSLMIIAPQGFGILLDIWKLKQASQFQRTETFPYFKLQDSESYLKSKTKELDEDAMKYMSYAMFPMILCYTVYSLFYKEHKGWYSFILNTLVGVIYVFGFIQMTPQLYINYRLKSVEHMPQKTLFYRFLNTIIDDLFSFIITMPTMHRISCFRDDVIFVIYLYQRYQYKVDKTRGMYADQDAIKEAAAKELTEKAEEPKSIEAGTESNKEAESNKDTAVDESVESKKDK